MLQTRNIETVYLHYTVKYTCKIILQNWRLKFKSDPRFCDKSILDRFLYYERIGHK